MTNPIPRLCTCFVSEGRAALGGTSYDRDQCVMKGDGLLGAAPLGYDPLWIPDTYNHRGIKLKNTCIHVQYITFICWGSKLALAL